MSFTRRRLSTALTIGLLLLGPTSVVQLSSSLTTRAHAAGVIGDDYPANLKNAAQDSQLDPWRFYNRECTSFVAWRLNSANHVGFNDFYGGPRWGNANNWGPTARSLGIPVNNTPAPGAVAWSNAGAYGHVAWVADVRSDGTIDIEQYNANYNGVYSTAHVAANSFTGYIHIQDLPTNAAPVGSLDQATATAPGTIRVRGWAFDPDSPSSPIHVHVYVGGPAGSGAPGYDLGPTFVARPDVQAAYPAAGPTTGFDATVTTNSAGNLPVYMYAIDSGGGTNPLIATRPVTVPNPNPEGHFDNVSSPGKGLVTVRGWSFDRSDPSARIHVHVYVGGPAGSSVPAYDIGPTHASRPDVAQAVPPAGAHTGFSATVPAPGGTVTLYAYGINVGVGTNSFLGTQTLTVVPGPASFPAQKATLTKLPSSTAKKTFVVSWHGAAARPSAISFDVRYRWRSTAKGAHWHAWGVPTSWANTTARSGTARVIGKRQYQFSARVRSAVAGKVPSAWSTARTIKIRS